MLGEGGSKGGDAAAAGSVQSWLVSGKSKAVKEEMKEEAMDVENLPDGHHSNPEQVKEEWNDDAEMQALEDGDDPTGPSSALMDAESDAAEEKPDLRLINEEDDDPSKGKGKKKTDRPLVVIGCVILVSTPGLSKKR